MNKTSKYLNKSFGKWVCTYVGIAHVQNARAKWAGHRSYFYVFERRTSDNKAEKIIRLSSTEAAAVYKGIKCIDEIFEYRRKKAKVSPCRKVSYHFDYTF